MALQFGTMKRWMTKRVTPQVMEESSERYEFAALDCGTTFANSGYLAPGGRIGTVTALKTLAPGFA